MIPVGANGESAPDPAPLPTMMAMRNGGMRARPATAIAIGASIAAVEMLPGPSDAIPQREEEERHRNEPGVATAHPQRLVCDLVERAIELRLRKQERDACQGQEQLDGKPRGDIVQRHPTEVDADNPRKGEGQHTHVQA